MARHKELVTTAHDAISCVFSDRSVSSPQTLDSLEELRDHVDELRDAVEADIRATQREEDRRMNDDG